ncbi:hypothetical protein GCM10010149_44450 [Nonomuraea roseoviolacea subsp. roseoviolacea]
MYVSEHVLLGSPGFIPDHLQSHETHIAALSYHRQGEPNRRYPGGAQAGREKFTNGRPPFR